MSLPSWISPAGDAACVIAIHAQPGAAKSEIAGEHGGALKLRIQARPVEGAANAALLAFLAKRLGVAKSTLTLVSGESSRQKRLRVPLPAAVVAERLDTDQQGHFG